MGSSEVKTTERVPYTVNYGVWLRIFAVAYALFAFWLLVFFKDEGQRAVFVFWQQTGWLGRVGVIMGFITIPGILLETFLNKVVFDACLIRRRNTMGKWHEYAYDQIVSMESFPGELIRIQFRDRRKLTIRNLMADLNRVEGVIHARARNLKCDNERN